MIADALKSVLTQQITQKVASAAGIDNAKAMSLVAAGLPIIMKGLAKNSATPQGAESLFGALAKHESADLSNPMDLLSKFSDGNEGGKILGHVFGSREAEIEAQLAQNVGVSQSQAGSVMKMLAPVVMGALGQEKASGGLNLGSLASVLGSQSSAMASNSSLSSSIMTSIFDKDGDGQVADDLLSMAWNFLKRFLSK